MKTHYIQPLFALPLALALAGGWAHADTDLQVTELWAGGLPGAEAISDWFEITNFGDEPAIGLDGNLYYDDRSNDPLLSDAITRIDTIAPGESVVVLTTWEDDYNNDVEAALAAFVAMWEPMPDLQVGVVHFGSGLGASGDAVSIFNGNTAEALTIDYVEYTGAPTALSYVSEADGTWGGRLAQVGVLGAREGNLPADNLSPDPPVGSPGVVVPEPTSIGLLLSGMLAWLWTVRRRRVRQVCGKNTGEW